MAKRKDPVSPGLRMEILMRDGECFAYKLAKLGLGQEHQCIDRWGRFHAPDNLYLLTLDHVHDMPGGIKGKRAPSDKRHLIAICGKLNVDGPSKTIREEARKYLRELYQ